MAWTNALILLAAIAGFAKLVVEVVNRLHARPWPEERLRHVRHAHDVLLVVFPPVLLWCVGWQGPGLLRGGSPFEAGAFWGGVLAVCLAGFLGLVYSSVRWSLRPRPGVLENTFSRVVDVEARLGHRPVRPGPYHVMTRVPGNQFLKVEVARHTFRLPRVPEAWDGLSILQLTDLHFTGTVDRPFFEEVVRMAQELEPDLIVMTGDLIDEPAHTDWIVPTLGRLSAPLGKFFILGNHDWWHDTAEIRAVMRECGWQDVSGRVAVLEHLGRPLAIGGTERPWMGDDPPWPSAPAEAFRILLSHTPDNVGRARRDGVDLMLSGHNHGGQVVLPVIGPVYSPSAYGTRYASGSFWQPPTLMHVCRGISGKHPLRINCLPEVSGIVLRPGVAEVSAGTSSATRAAVG